MMQKLIKGILIIGLCATSLSLVAGALPSNANFNPSHPDSASTEATNNQGAQSKDFLNNTEEKETTIQETASTAALEKSNKPMTNLQLTNKQIQKKSEATFQKFENTNMLNKKNQP